MKKQFLALSLAAATVSGCETPHSSEIQAPVAQTRAHVDHLEINWQPPAAAPVMAQMPSLQAPTVNYEPAQVAQTENVLIGQSADCAELEKIAGGPVEGCSTSLDQTYEGQVSEGQVTPEAEVDCIDVVQAKINGDNKRSPNGADNQCLEDDFKACSEAAGDDGMELFKCTSRKRALHGKLFGR